MELIIVRHARPEHVEDADGAADPPLSDVGRVQAERVGDHLAGEGVDHLVSSPMRRAVETAAPLAVRLGLDPEIVDDLAEYDRDESSYVPAEIRRANRDEGWADPLGEMGHAERDAWIAGVGRAFHRIILDNPGRRVAVFCHGMVTSVWFAQVLGIDDLIRFTPDYCGVTRMLANARTDYVTVRSFNETHFLGDSHIPLFEK
jgi:probable phosphoglycerate mutase